MKNVNIVWRLENSNDTNTIYPDVLNSDKQRRILEERKVYIVSKKAAHKFDSRRAQMMAKKRMIMWTKMSAEERGPMNYWDYILSGLNTVNTKTTARREAA